MSFPRYPKYKDSGIEWLGEVPAHWAVDRLKWSVSSCSNGVWGVDPQNDDSDIACVRVADFDRLRLRVVLQEPTIRSVTQKERVGRVLSRGDLLLEKSGGGETQPVGCVVLYDDPTAAVCSNFVARIRLAVGMNSSFWRYFHAAAYAVRRNTRSIKQTSGIQNLDQQQYLDELGVFPPTPEQDAIAAFLDRETAKIDALVAEQERLIALLQEKRQAVISHAVTKGLNPDAPMKASGVGWLGDLPAHWGVTPLKHAVRLRGGVTPAKDNHLYWNGDVPWASSKDLKAALLDDTEDHISQTALDDGVAELVEPGSVLVVVRGMILAHTFPVSVALKPMAINQDLKALVPNDGISPAFLPWLLRGASRETLGRVDEAAHGTKVLRMDAWTSLLLPIAPEPEQAAITAFIERETARIDALVVEQGRVLALLQERRTAVVSAAVTGQIDVRQFGEQSVS